jgi:hypothetical protein
MPAGFRGCGGKRYPFGEREQGQQAAGSWYGDAGLAMLALASPQIS